LPTTPEQAHTLLIAAAPGVCHLVLTTQAIAAAPAPTVPTSNQQQSSFQSPNQLCSVVCLLCLAPLPVLFAAAAYCAWCHMPPSGCPRTLTALFSQAAAMNLPLGDTAIWRMGALLLAA
jgi:hypothetical protein